MKKRILLALVAVAMTLSAEAMPAKKQITVRQSDGTELTLRAYGDEWHHYLTTTDGYTVLQGTDGSYYYAAMTPDGSLAPSQVRVNNPSRRTVAERAALSGMRQNLVDYSAIQRGQMLRREANMRRGNIAEPSRNMAMAQAEGGTRAAMGTARTLVLLVQFKDNTFTKGSNAVINNLLNQSNYNGTGSAKDYYEQNSDGQFTVNFDVYGPYTLPQNMSYYGANSGGDDIRPQQMVIDGCNLANNDVNFANYAVSGEVPNLIVIYAGYGEADSGKANTIWPHEWSLPSPRTYDGVKVYTYACSSELQGSGALTGIGVICHEYGHALGLPDFYDTDYTDNGYSFGLNVLSLMDMGGYCYDGAYPPALNIAERWIIGWIPSIPQITATGNYTLAPVYTGHVGYYLPTKTANEAYIIENRNGALFKWDRVLQYGDAATTTTGSGRGMLVYHYDKSSNSIGGYSASTLWSWNMINAVSSHECFRLVKAQSVSVGNRGGIVNIGKVFYPGDGNITQFSVSGWTSGAAGITIKNIAMSGNNVTFTAEVDGSVDDPTISNVVVKPNQNDITLTWDGSNASTWRVDYRATGTSTYSSVTVNSKIANLPNCKPNTSYEIVITDINAGVNVSASGTTGSVQVTKYPSLNGIKAGYTTSEPIILSAINLQSTITKIEWRVDGTLTESTCITLAKGNHTIEAKVINADGSLEYLKRIIKVN